MTNDEFLEEDLNGDDIKTRNDLETLHQAYLWFLITVNNSENHTKRQDNEHLHRNTGTAPVAQRGTS